MGGLQHDGPVQPGDGCFGVYPVDKPEGLSSFAIVRRIRKLLGIKKVGHAGTLDPFATGLLIVCVGRPATRLIDRFMSGRKVYRATLQLGVETETQDPEGLVIATRPVPDLDNDRIETVLSGFLGKSFQTPPPFSAAKYKGKPLYHYARKGIEVKKDPKEIEIFSLSCDWYEPFSHQLGITVVCSRGTYIRVLASDIGEKLGCGAHLIALRRLGSGKFSVDKSLDGHELMGDRGRELLIEGRITLESISSLLDDDQGPESGQCCANG